MLGTGLFTRSMSHRIWRHAAYILWVQQRSSEPRLIMRAPFMQGKVTDSRLLAEAEVQQVGCLWGRPPPQQWSSKTSGTAAFKAQSLLRHQDKRSLTETA